MNDKTKIEILKSYLTGLHTDLTNRLIKCPECEYSIKYIEECFERLDKLEEIVK